MVHKIASDGFARIGGIRAQQDHWVLDAVGGEHNDLPRYEAIAFVKRKSLAVLVAPLPAPVVHTGDALAAFIQLQTCDDRLSAQDRSRRHGLFDVKDGLVARLDWTQRNTRSVALACRSPVVLARVNRVWNGVDPKPDPAHGRHSCNRFRDFSVQIAWHQGGHRILDSVPFVPNIVPPLFVISGHAHLPLTLDIPAFEVVIVQWPIHALAVERLHGEIVWHHPDMDALPVPCRSSDQPLVEALEFVAGELRRIDVIIRAQDRSARSGLAGSNVVPAERCVGCLRGRGDEVADQSITSERVGWHAARLQDQYPHLRSGQAIGDERASDTRSYDDDVEIRFREVRLHDVPLTNFNDAWFGLVRVVELLPNDR